MLQQLSPTKRRILAALLAAAGLVYAVLVVVTYLQVTPPSRVAPDMADIHRLLFFSEKPISPMQRRLEAADTPLGAGPLITGRPLDQYTEFNSVDLAEREAERQALLDWIRCGGSRTAYEQDDYAVADPASVTRITPKLLIRNTGVPNASTVLRVRIRTLINERCLSCHNDDGDDTARLIPFDTYDAIARYLIPDDHTARARAWLFAALLSLFPLAFVAGSLFAFTTHPLCARKALLAVTFASLSILAACWVLGSSFAPLLLVAAVVALICVMVQILATFTELFNIRRARDSFSVSVLDYGHC